MSKLKLLYITHFNENRVSQGNYYFQTELARITDLTVWHEPGNIQDILAKLTISPDFILINEYGGKGPKINGLSTLSIPYGIYLQDLHVNLKGIKIAIRKDKVRYIFSTCRDKFQKWLPEFKNRRRWLPHHVNPNVFKDYGLTKENDLLLMGNVNKRLYPLRWKIHEVLQDKPNFVYHEHPGQREFKPHEMRDLLIGEKYAREINRSKIFITCNSIYKNPSPIYYEVLACKTLLLAPSSKELKDLGFIPGVHFVKINEHDFEEKAEYYLKNEEERLKIAEQGYRMVHEYHTTAIRAHQLVVMIGDILENYQPTPNKKEKAKRSVVKKTKKHFPKKKKVRSTNKIKQNKRLKTNQLTKITTLQRKVIKLQRKVKELQQAGKK
ncbi:glycosyltransferase family protein [Brevibacillus sp. H7]|uniref:glycosyltransferase family protein n=1 Tax=Brevibacillus sp. H7 TaxID=3349138 RepID=UPI0038080AF7